MTGFPGVCAAKSRGVLSVTTTEVNNKKDDSRAASRRVDGANVEYNGGKSGNNNNNNNNHHTLSDQRQTDNVGRTNAAGGQHRSGGYIRETSRTEITNSNSEIENGHPSEGRTATRNTSNNVHGDTADPSGIRKSYLSPSSYRDNNSSIHNMVHQARPVMTTGIRVPTPTKINYRSSSRQRNYGDTAHTRTGMDIVTKTTIANKGTAAVSARGVSALPKRSTSNSRLAQTYNATTRRSPARSRDTNYQSSSDDQRDPPPDSMRNTANKNAIDGSRNRSSSKQRISGIPRAVNNDDPNELVCDYDTSATVLYELLESSNWEKARNRCRSHPDETKTWIVRRDKNNKVRWKLLPLHAAIIFQSPHSVISALMEYYAIASTKPDDQGMLPLHLAFRHKQDDEELLETLLSSFPQAVMLKDRRDRVPLEHGRDSKFSAKVLRLYADATLSASTTINKQGVDYSASAMKESILKNTSCLGTSVLRSNHHDIIINGQSTQETLSMTASADRLVKLESDHQRAIQKLKIEHEQEIKKTKKYYEDRIQTLKEQNDVNQRQMKLVNDDERRVLIDQHKNEVDGIKSILTDQLTKDKTMVEALQHEVVSLQTQYKEKVHQHESTISKYNNLQTYTNEIKSHLEKISMEQFNMREMAIQQQEELNAARNIRTQLVETLLRQEDSDSENDRLRGNKIIESADRVNRRIASVLEYGGSSQQDYADYEYNHLQQQQQQLQQEQPQQQRYSSQMHNNRRTNDETERVRVVVAAKPIETIILDNTNERPSRVEQERSDAEGVEIVKTPTGPPAPVFSDSKLEDDPFLHDRSHTIEEEIPGSEQILGIHITNETMMTDEKNEAGNDYHHDVRILGDDISAITDHSGY